MVRFLVSFVVGGALAAAAAGAEAPPLGQVRICRLAPPQVYSTMDHQTVTVPKGIWLVQRFSDKMESTMAVLPPRAEAATLAAVVLPPGPTCGTVRAFQLSTVPIKRGMEFNLTDSDTVPTVFVPPTVTFAGTAVGDFH